MGDFRKAKYFDMIRILRFRNVLDPVFYLIEAYNSTGSKRIEQLETIIYVFFAFVTLGHLSACVWLYFGRMDEDLPPEERESWLYVNDLTGEGVGNLPSPFAAYIFSLYWVFETFTTVGYGDYSGGTSAEYGVTLFFEFIGFCYNAVLISIMTSFFSNEYTFQDLLSLKLFQMDIWMRRIELSYKPYYLPRDLGK